MSMVSFLAEFMRRVQPFQSVITHIHMKELDDGHLFVTAPAMDGSVLINATSKEPIDIQGARACLGNLAYLRSLLQSSLVTSQTPVDIDCREHRNGKVIMQSMRFHPKEGMAMTYVGSDPFRESIMKPAKLNIPEWPVMFLLDQATVSDLDQIKTVHANAPSTDREDVFLLKYQRGDIEAHFGSDSHTTHYGFNVAVEGDLDKKFELYLPSKGLLDSLSHPQAIKAEDILCELADSAMRISYVGHTAEHNITLFKRKMRND